MPIRILIADDHAVVRSGLRALLRSDPDLEVVGEAEDGTETLRLAETLHPDTVLLDITMPPENGIETAKRLKEKHPELIVLFLTMHEDESLLHEALRAGASGYVIKRAEESEIIQAIHAASRGDIYVHPAMTRALLHQPVTTEHRRGSPVDALTPREPRRSAPPRQGKHQPADCRPARPLGAHRREPPRQPDGQARAGQPGRAGELRRGAQPSLARTWPGEASPQTDERPIKLSCLLYRCPRPAGRSALRSGDFEI